MNFQGWPGDLPCIWRAFMTSSESWKLSSEFYLLRGSLALWWPSSISWSCPATKAEAWDGSRWNGSQRPTTGTDLGGRDRGAWVIPIISQHLLCAHVWHRNRQTQLFPTTTGKTSKWTGHYNTNRASTRGKPRAPWIQRGDALKTKLSTRWAGRYLDTQFLLLLFSC